MVVPSLLDLELETCLIMMWCMRLFLLNCVSVGVCVDCWTMRVMVEVMVSSIGRPTGDSTRSAEADICREAVGGWKDSC